MSLFRSEQFYVWFPAIVVAFLIGLVVAALWDFIRRRVWLFVSRGSPGILKEVGLDSPYQSRAEAEERLRETIDKLNNIIARGMNLPLPPKAPNSGASAAIDIEEHAEINTHHAASGIRSFVQGTYSISASSQNQLYSGEAFEDEDCRPIVNFSSYFPDGTSKDVTRPAKKFYKRYANGRVKRIKSSIILQASIAINPRVLAEIVELAKHCMQKENRCIFQLGNWAILYHNAVEVQMHLLTEGDVPVNIEARWQDGRTGITMRGLYLTGAQVKVGTKRASKILRSAGPATQGVGDLDELHLPAREFDVPGEDSLIFASKMVVVDEVSVIVRSEASLILPPREENVLQESSWTRWLQISKKILRSLWFGAEDCTPERAANRRELEFDRAQQLELSVEHWKGLSEIELLNTRKEVLLHLQEQRNSGIIERAGPPSPDSYLFFVRNERKCWQEGLRVLNEVIHRNSNGSHFHAHIRVRGGIHFLLEDYESALRDYDLALLDTGGHQSTVLRDRALVKCMLGRYSEAMQDVFAVVTLNPNANDIREFQTCIQQILDQQKSFRIVTESGSSCQRPLPPDQGKAVVKIPDLLTGDEWHSGEIGSQLSPICNAGTAGSSASDPSMKRARSLGVARAADWSVTSVAEALKLQLLLTNCAEYLKVNPRYHVRGISFVVNILEDEFGPDDVMKQLSLEEQELLNWQASTEDLKGDLGAGRETLIHLSGRLCPHKNISRTLYSNVTDVDSSGHPPVFGRHVSYRSALLTKHSAAEGDFQTLFLYDGTPVDRSIWRMRSHDYVKELFLPEARSPYRAFWLVQWDVVDKWRVVQGQRWLWSYLASAIRRINAYLFQSPAIFQVTAGGTSSPTSDGYGLNNFLRLSKIKWLDTRKQEYLFLQKLGVSAVSQKYSYNEYRGVPYIHPDYRTWIAEMRPPKYKNKPDYGMLKFDAEAARAIDTALYHYGRPDLLNFPDSSLQFVFTEPTAPPGLDEKAKMKFVKGEAKLLQAAVDATSPLQSTPTESLSFPIQLSAALRRCQSRYSSEISLPFSCSGPGDADAIVSQTQQCVDHDSICDVSATGVQTNWRAVDFHDALRDCQSIRRIAEEFAAGTSSPASNSNDLNRHRFHFKRRAAIIAHYLKSETVKEKPQTSLQTQTLRTSGVDSVFITISENSTSGRGSSSINARRPASHHTHRSWDRGDVPASLCDRGGIPIASFENPVGYRNSDRNSLESGVGDEAKIMNAEGSTRFTWPEAVDILIRIGESMASLHGPIVAHRDLKPLNILCPPLHTIAESGSAVRPEHDSSVRLADVGLARSQSQSSGGEALMGGTDCYKAPEMLEVIEFPRQADVYSFGMVCYEILTGKLPFEEYRHQDLSLHASRPLDNPTLPGVPEALRKLLHQCLDSNPAQRPTFDDIVMRLRECKVQAYEDTGD